MIRIRVFLECCWSSIRASSELSIAVSAQDCADFKRMPRDLGPHTSVTGRALLCRFCGLEAFAVDSRRCQDRPLLNFTWGRGVGSGGGGEG